MSRTSFHSLITLRFSAGSVTVSMETLPSDQSLTDFNEVVSRVQTTLYGGKKTKKSTLCSGAWLYK